jgi:YD repeat-containing protein
MRKFFVFGGIMLMFFASCKKEDSNEAAATPLLDRVVTRFGSDSTVTTYSYNSAGKITGESSRETDGSNSSLTFERDSQGRISRITSRLTAPGTAAETDVTDYIYLGPADVKVRNGLNLFNSGTVQVRDSIAFTYSGNRVTRTDHFYSASGIPPVNVIRYEFQYDARGNMTQVRLSQVTSLTGPLQVSGTLNLSYDDKTNPLYTTDDALVELVTTQYVSPGNVTRLNFVAPDPADNFNATITYEYGTDGRPTKATLTESGSSTVSTYTYK